MRRFADFAQRISQTAEETGFSGTISIRQGEEDLYSRSFGFRMVGEKLPNGITTRFGIASGTKLLTALGIGRLIDSGDLSLAAGVGQFGADLGGFIGEQATVRDLLTHTSGIYDYYDEELVTDFEHYTVGIPWSRLETPSDYLPLFENQTMKFRPGRRFSYSNGGYVLLGVIIERVSGGLYRDFIERNLLVDAGMASSGFHAFNELPANTAWGYLRDRSTTNIHNLPIRGGGDGGMYSTAEDMHTLWRRLFSCSLLSSELTEDYLRTHQQLDATRGYGLGVYKSLDDRSFWVVGSDVGVGFFSSYSPPNDTSVAVLSNITDGQRMIATFINEQMKGGA